MNFDSIVDKKNKGTELLKEEIQFVVDGYVSGNITDEKMTSFLKVVFKKSMTESETVYLTKAMELSGDVIDLSDCEGLFVDKHSSGGISDTTTLVLAPMVACMGLKMLKMSGRALGFTGGTADKLEVFENYQTGITIEDAKRLVDTNGAALITQTLNLVPADKKIYALRDKTGYVDSIPLIASSIMSKKLASGADIMVLDVKYGKGALMKTKKLAISLAKLMVKIGKADGKKVCAFITDMTEPLGNNVGDLCEVAEAQLAMLGLDGRLLKLSKLLSAKLCQMAYGKTVSYYVHKIEEKILSGEVFDKFRQIIIGQGGIFENKSEILKNIEKIDAFSKYSGYIKEINGEKIGTIVHEMKKKYGQNAGLILHKKVSSKCKKGDLLFQIVCGDISFKSEIERCFSFSKIYKPKKKLVAKIID